MKTLLDEQLDKYLKVQLAGFPVYTVKDMGWLGLKNGKFREKMQEKGFELLVTADKNMPFQTNLTNLPYVLMIIDTPSTLFDEHVVHFIPKIKAFLKNPPSPLPKVVHVSVENMSKGEKLAALQRLLPAEDLLLL